MFIVKWLFPIVIMGFLAHIFVTEIHPNNSSYSFRLGVLDCNNVDHLGGCRHEIGHKMDNDLGMPSISTDFVMVANVYSAYMIDGLHTPDDLAVFIRVYPDKRPVELYAAIYSYVEGDVSRLPKSIRAFYSTDQKYLDLYDCLNNLGFNICNGLNFSNLKGIDNESLTSR